MSEFYTSSGKKIEQGDFVIRKRKSENNDWFKCHPFSFGQIIEFVKEDYISRPDAPHIKHRDSWTEILIIPFDKTMAPIAEKGWIQWTPKEVIKISPFAYGLMCCLWPILKLIYCKPLSGRITDW